MKGSEVNLWQAKREVRNTDSPYQYRPVPKKEEYLLVDGYNIIFSWEDLNELSKTNVAAARQKLMDVLCNYQGFKRCEVIVVFDAYKVKGNVGEISKYHNITIVYTKEAETADRCICSPARTPVYRDQMDK